MRRLTVLAASVSVLLVSAGAASPTPQMHAATQGRWVIRDLGTLGGKESEANALNDRGQVVGRADTMAKDKATPISHAFLWKNGKMRDLGTLGGKWSEAEGINDRGQVVGWSYTKKGDRRRAFLWQKGRMRELGTLGGEDSEAVAINERGQVIGYADTMAKDKDGDPISHAFLWQNGTMRDLGSLGGESSYARDTNNDGQIVGDAAIGAKDRFGDAIRHAFLWQNGKMTDLGTLGGPGSGAGAIDERGRVVGAAATKGKAKDALGDWRPIFHAFLWQNAKMRDLGTLRARGSSAHDINERSQIVGFAYNGRWYYSEGGWPLWPLGDAFLWQNGKMRDLGTLGGDESDAAAINERGEIVGEADTQSGKSHAVLWTYKP